MISKLIKGFILVLIAFVIIPNVVMAEPDCFMWGFSITWPQDLLQCNGASGSDLDKVKEAIDRTAEVGGKWLRLHVVWRDIEPNILFPTIPSVESITSEDVNQYLLATAAEGDWGKYDEYVNYASEKGVNLIFILGTGFDSFLPDYNGSTISVDDHPDIYQTCLALHARAVVRKYKHVVQIWQLENELNTAGSQQFPPYWNWRSGEKWQDISFCRSLIWAMQKTVKDEQPDAKVYTNFHFMDPLAIVNWSPLLDFIGVDIYWDKVFLQIKPIIDGPLGHVTGAQFLSGGKPILISEIGYNGSTSEWPLALEQEQAEWIQESAQAAINSGAIGYLYWTVSTPEESSGHGDEFMGLIRHDCQPKIGYQVYQTVISNSSPNDPIPDIYTNITAINIDAEEESTIDFTVTNNGGPSSSSSYFSVSISDGLFITNVQCPGLQYQVNTPGDGLPIWGKDNSVIDDADQQYTLLDCYGEFASGETIPISVTVKGNNVGAQWLKYRATFDNSCPWQDRVNYPEESSHTDEQGWPVELINILVVDEDNTNPIVSITSPTSDQTFFSYSSSIDIGGLASDNTGITNVTWENNRGGSGTCNGTTSWYKNGIQLFTGENIITVTAHDPDGNSGSDTITVTYEEDSEGATITSPNGGEEWALGSTHNITWTGATDLPFKIRLDDHRTGQVIFISHEGIVGGSYSWTIPTDLTPGAYYVIKIWCYLYPPDVPEKIEYYDYSDNHFSITGPLTISASAGTGGTISPSGDVAVPWKGNQTFTINPDQGYYILDVQIDDESVGAISSYTFNNVIDNHTISATFAKHSYTITSSAGTGGNIDPPGIVTVFHGDDQTFTITPTANYHTADVFVDGSSVGPQATFTFTNITSNHSITATFENNTADLLLNKTDETDPITAGNQQVYNLTVTNSGQWDATNVVLMDNYPPELENPEYSMDGGVNWDALTGSLNLGTIIPGNYKDVFIRGTISISAIGTITNTASVSSDTNDPNLLNNIDSEETTIESSCPLPAAPSSPSPSDTATDVDIDANLDWNDSSGATSYDVYFDTTSPTSMVGTVADSSYDPGTLEYNTHYFWQIVAKNSCGNTPGPVWEFTTVSLPNEPPIIDSFTADPTSGPGPLTVDFTCSAHDTDGDVVEYRWDYNNDDVIDETTMVGTASYEYASEGAYEAKVTVVDDDDATKTSDPIPIEVGAPGLLPFYDNFEDYTVGSAPSSPWTTLWYAAKVIDVTSHSGSKSLRVWGAPSGCRSAVIDLGTDYPDQLSYQAWVKLNDLGRAVFIGFFDQIGGMAPQFNCVYFGNGNVYFKSADSNNSINILLYEGYSLSTWHKVRVDLDFQKLKGFVYLDNQLIAEDIPISPRNVVYNSTNTFMRKLGVCDYGSTGDDVYIDDFAVSRFKTHCVSDVAELQAALNDAEANGAHDIIQVVQGTYYGNFTFDSTEALGITLLGGYTAECTTRVVDPTNTTLDAEDSDTVLDLNNSAGGDIFVEGFTIQNGGSTEHGGGVYASTYSDSGTAGDITLTNNTITGNSTSSGYEGGGVYATSSSDSGIAGNITLTNNTIQGNTASNWGGGVAINTSVPTGTVGGGTVTITNNIISGNTADGGGGVHVYSLSGAGALGESSVTLTNNTITGNSASSSDGGVYAYSYSDSGTGGTIAFTNNTITGNIASVIAGGLETWSTGNTINCYNNIVWGNVAYSGGNIYLDGIGTANGYNNDYADISGSWTAEDDNINADPLFADPGYWDDAGTPEDPSDDIWVNGDYHLRSNSPCIDAATDLVPDLPLTDFEGDPRIINGAPDMGADEARVLPVQSRKLIISPSGLGFGEIAVGSTGQLSLSMYNGKETDIGVTDITNPSAPYSITANGCTGATLGSGDTCVITVEFAPTSAGNCYDYFLITTDDPSVGTVRVDLSGQGVAE